MKNKSVILFHLTWLNNITHASIDAIRYTRHPASRAMKFLVYLSERKWIEEGTYPPFTMIEQNFGSVYVRVLLIISDMVSQVRQRDPIYNNDPLITKSIWLPHSKVIYYTIFSWMYGFAGSCAYLAMINFSWTQIHIVKFWGVPRRSKRIYLPCDLLKAFRRTLLSLEIPSDTKTIIYVAQLFPENANTFLLEAFSVAIKKLDPGSPRPELQFRRLQKLKEIAIKLDVEGCRIPQKFVVQIHSMVDEHFGIKGKQTGFLAQNAKEYADAIPELLKMADAERLGMTDVAIRRSRRFSEERFYEDFKAAISPV
ncbi:hypothetical protein MKW94_003164 [Papaver nudicaule]|uniref:ALG11 mannosyltransferase N-terminal domain-containing protein n=1 Tax=Papaver nudicaule TaxID=74823 RepID=A0AA42B294_PAPNU|nr:hypothetical protein [Papaver nudicaule]